MTRLAMAGLDLRRRLRDLAARQLFGQPIHRLKGFFGAIALVTLHFVFMFDPKAVSSFRWQDVGAEIAAADYLSESARLEANQMFLHAKKGADEVASTIKALQSAGRDILPGSPEWQEQARRLDQPSPLFMLHAQGRYVEAPGSLLSALATLTAHAKSQDEAIRLITRFPGMSAETLRGLVGARRHPADFWCRVLEADTRECGIHLQADLVRSIQVEVIGGHQTATIAGPTLTRTTAAPDWRTGDEGVLTFIADPLQLRRGFAPWDLSYPVADISVGGTLSAPSVEIRSRQNPHATLLVPACVEDVLELTKRIRSGADTDAAAATTLCTIDSGVAPPPVTLFCGNEDVPNSIAICPAKRPIMSAADHWGGKWPGMAEVAGEAPKRFEFTRAIDSAAIQLFEKAHAEGAASPTVGGKPLSPEMDAALTAVLLDYATVLGDEGMPSELAAMSGAAESLRNRKAKVLSAIARQPHLLAYHRDRAVLAPFVYDNLLRQLRLLGLMQAR